ncbi:hypothetical protein VNI00_014081 [Paramarasmius palmivorus]|uniref:F-box domain-containing protein n=1 Tax=Paramarasmius palmivorus TaxID=297713 RepID=A0AAW0BV13_9AGAR
MVGEDYWSVHKQGKRPAIEYLVPEIQKQTPVTFGLEFCPDAAELLRTGRRVSQTDAVHYQQLIRSTEQYALFLRSQIENFHRALSKVEGNKKKYQSLFSPLRKIPPEVLSRIMSFVPMPSVFSADLSGCKSWPATLSGVCYHWREVVLSTPHLWTEVHIELDPKAKYSSALVENLRLHLERSKAVPLNVSILYSGHGALDTFTPSGSQVIMILLNGGSEWSELRFSGFGARYSDISQFFRLFDKKLASLEHMEVATGSDGRRNPSVLHLMQGYPSTLHALSIHRSNRFPLPSFPQLPFPFEQITHLQLDNSLKVALAFIERCHNLQFAHITVVAPRDEDPDHDVDNPCASNRDDAATRKMYPLCHLPFLDDLTLQIRDLQTTHEELPMLPLYRLFYSISAPRLSSLVLASDATTHERDPLMDAFLEKGLRELVSRSSPPLRRLYSVRIPFTAGSMLRLLEQMPILEELGIRELPGGETKRYEEEPHMYALTSAPMAANDILKPSFLEAFKPIWKSKEPNLLLTKLRHVDFQFPEARMLNSIIKLFELRMAVPGSRLRSAMIKVEQSGTDGEVIANLKSLQDAGFAVRLWSPNHRLGYMNGAKSAAMPRLD